MLNQARVLIVEDEFLIAEDLRLSVTEAGGVVVGPCYSVKEALLALASEPPPRAAILDINLPDGEVTPVALVLLQSHIPIVIHSASPLPKEIATANVGLRICQKLVLATVVVTHLAELLEADHLPNGVNPR